jgi:hypothetical protein
MKSFLRTFFVIIVLIVFMTFATENSPKTDLEMVSKIREEGFQRSQVMDTVGYMTDVLGARLTLSQDMARAQIWAMDKMEKIGLVNTVIEPFMDYGVAWDNEYFSLHLLKPDYQPMVGFPLTHTPSTKGKITCPVVIADVKIKKDLDQFRGKLKGAAVLSTPPAVIDLERMAQATPRRTPEELKQLEEDVIPKPRRRRGPPAPPNPELLKAVEIIEFFKTEGVRAVFECRSGRPGLVRGFARPGTKQDNWSREKSLASLPIIAVTPEHYNRMYRILKRNIPVFVEIEVRNRLGKSVEKACNVFGEIPGTDLKEEVVMIGAHFDTWAPISTPGMPAPMPVTILRVVQLFSKLHVSSRRRVLNRAARSEWLSGEVRSRESMVHVNTSSRTLGIPRIRRSELSQIMKNYRSTSIRIMEQGHSAGYSSRGTNMHADYLPPG